MKANCGKVNFKSNVLLIKTGEVELRITVCIELFRSEKSYKAVIA